MATKTTCTCDRCGREIPPPDRDNFPGKFIKRKSEAKPTGLKRIGVCWPFKQNIPVQCVENKYMLCECCDAEFMEWMLRYE